MTYYAAESCDHCGEPTPRLLPAWRCMCCAETGATVFMWLMRQAQVFEWGRRPEIEPRLPVHREYS